MTTPLVERACAQFRDPAAAPGAVQPSPSLAHGFALAGLRAATYDSHRPGPSDPVPTRPVSSMKTWTFVVSGLYALVLALLTIPMFLLGPWKAPELLGLYGAWHYWLWLAIMAGCQLVLLMVPVRVANRRPISRGALWPTVLLVAFMMTLLCAAAVLSVYASRYGDNPLFAGDPWLLGLLVTTLWLLWAALFHRLSRTQPPLGFVSQLCARLVRGSILELLIAVPCHIIVRSRGDCCAGIYTMFGLALGTAVMLFAFGPAVFFLFVARARQLKPGPPSPILSP